MDIVALLCFTHFVPSELHLVFFVTSLLAVVSWLCVLRLHWGRFLGAWWIHRKPVIYTSVNIQVRWRSDFRKGCMLQRLPAQIRIPSLRTLSSPLHLSTEHDISLLSVTWFLLSSSHSLPLCCFLSCCVSFSLSLCLLDMLRFQSWWVTPLLLLDSS